MGGSYVFFIPLLTWRRERRKTISSRSGGGGGCRTLRRREGGHKVKGDEVTVLPHMLLFFYISSSLIAIWPSPSWSYAIPSNSFVTSHTVLNSFICLMQYVVLNTFEDLLSSFAVSGVTLMTATGCYRSKKSRLTAPHGIFYSGFKVKYFTDFSAEIESEEGQAWTFINILLVSFRLFRTEIKSLWF